MTTTKFSVAGMLKLQPFDESVERRTMILKEFCHPRLFALGLGILIGVCLLAVVAIPLLPPTSFIWLIPATVGFLLVTSGGVSWIEWHQGFRATPLNRLFITLMLTVILTLARIFSW